MAADEREYASKMDLNRVETKVDGLTTMMFDVREQTRSISDRFTAKDAMEKQAQVLLAEANATRAAAASEKASNAEDWNKLKTRALWTCMAFIVVISYPNVLNLVKQIRGVVP